MRTREHTCKMDINCLCILIAALHVNANVVPAESLLLKNMGLLKAEYLPIYIALLKAKYVRKTVMVS